MRKSLRKTIAAILLCAIAVTSPGNMTGLLNNTGTVKATIGGCSNTFSVEVNDIKWTVDYTYYPYNPDASYAKIKSATAVKNQKNEGAYNIPEYIEFYNDNIHQQIKVPVTEIPHDTFQNATFVKTVTFGENITEIGYSAFYHCSNLESVSQINQNENNNAIDIGFATFYECEKLKKLDFYIGDIGGYGLSYCPALKEINNFVGSSIGMCACIDSGIEKFDFSKCSNLTLGCNSFENTNLKEIDIPCDIDCMGNSAFTKCKKLRKAEFEGKVNVNYSAFKDSFNVEYEDDDKKILIEKSITFHDDVQVNQEAFAGCNGLTKIVFEKNATLGGSLFYDVEINDEKEKTTHICENLNDVEFYGDVKLGVNVFQGAINLNTTMNFPGNVSSIDMNDTESPFGESTITDINFNGENYTPTAAAITVNCNISSPNVRNITYGRNVNSTTGTILANYLENIIFMNPDIVINLKDQNYKKHKVYGFSADHYQYQNVENWIVSNKKYKYTNCDAEFVNIVNKLEVEEPDTYYGAINKKDIDFNNLSVKYLPTYANSEKYETVPYETDSYKVKNNIDNTGYIVYSNDIPEILTPRAEAYTFKVEFSNVKSDFIHIKVEDIIPQKLDIDWKTDNIKELVASDDVKIQDVVSGVAVTYNNGEVKEFTSADLDNFTLENTTTHNDTVKAGKNSFAVTYHETSKYIKDEDGNYKNYKASASKEFDIQKNYVTAINAELVEKTRYVGDTITKDDIILRATYKNDKDTTVPKEVEPSSIENVVLTASGTSIVVVNYGNLQTKVEVPTKELVPTKIAASFEKTNAYIEGQKEFDLDAFHIAVTYNSGLVKDNYDKKNLVLTKENCKVEKLVSTSTEIKVKIVYMENGVSVDTAEIEVPITPKKLTEISAVSKVDSMVEGTIFPQSNLEALTLTYNNGNTETLDATSLDFDQLEIQQDKIVADQDNEIKITYQGVSTTITVHGVKKEIESVEAKYMGQPVVVGQYLKLSDVEVTVFYNNGQSEVLSSGYVVKEVERKISKIGDNEIKIYFDTFEATIIVPGITEDMNIVSSHVPTSTSIVTTGNTTDHTEVMNTIAPTNNAEQTTTNNAEPTTTNLAANTISSTVISTFNITSNIKNLVLGQTTKTVYTNKTVQLQIASDKISNLQYQFVTTKLSNKAWKNLSDTKLTVKKAKTPTVVYFRYTDATGKTITTQTIQFVIDKIKPSVNVKKGKTYKKGMKLQFSDASGIRYAKLDGKKVKNKTKISKKGSHKIVVVDLANNKQTMRFKIK